MQKKPNMDQVDKQCYIVDIRLTLTSPDKLITTLLHFLLHAPISDCAHLLESENLGILEVNHYICNIGTCNFRLFLKA